MVLLLRSRVNSKTPTQEGAGAFKAFLKLCLEARGVGAVTRAAPGGVADRLRGRQRGSRPRPRRRLSLRAVSGRRTVLRQRRCSATQLRPQVRFSEPPGLSGMSLY